MSRDEKTLHKWNSVDENSTSINPNSNRTSNLANYSTSNTSNRRILDSSLTTSSSQQYEPGPSSSSNTNSQASTNQQPIPLILLIPPLNAQGGNNPLNPSNELPVGWWTIEGLTMEEALVFDDQFIYARTNPPAEGEANADQPQFSADGRPTQPRWITSSTARMVWLTLVLLGLQFTWSLELSYGTPYLLSLGLSKSAMSLVWLAGPLSGLIMQPLIGALSDRCQSRLGRRRPFILVGGFGVLFSLISIGWTVELVLYLGGPESAARPTAILAFYILDFSINIIQAASRALIVDILPASMQEAGNAWAGRMIGVGNVLGYLMGYLDLVSTFPYLGDKQLKVLSFFACILLIITSGVTCGMIREIPYEEESQQSTLVAESGWEPIIKALKEIVDAASQLPQPIISIFRVQFFAWIGWFPFMFYATTWVAEFLAPSLPDDNFEGTGDSVGESTRAGSRAFLFYSIVSMVSSFLIPLLTRSNPTQPSLLLPKFLSASLEKLHLKDFFDQVWPQVVIKLPTMPHYFTISLVLYSLLMLSTIFIKSSYGATLIITLCGIPWAIAMWAPFVMIGEFVHHHPSKDSNTNYVPLQNMSNNNTTWEEPPPNYTETPNPPAPVSAGILLGIHNVAIVIPQLLTSLVASLLFTILGSSSSVSWIMALGGLSSIVGAYYSTKLWQ